MKGVQASVSLLILGLYSIISLRVYLVALLSLRPPGLIPTQIQLASHILTEIDTYAHPPWGVSAQSIVFVIGYQ